MPQTSPKIAPYEDWLAGLRLLPEETDASRRDAERAVSENRRAAERFAAGQAVVMVPQPVQHQQAQASAAMSAREVAAAHVSIGRLRSKAVAASNPIDAARANAAADRIAADIAESGVQAWIQTSPTRRDLIDAEGVTLGSVTRLYGQWYADLVPAEAHSPTTRTALGGFFTEAEARAEVERFVGRPPQIRRPYLGARLTPDASEHLGPADCLDAGYGRAA